MNMNTCVKHIGIVYVAFGAEYARLAAQTIKISRSATALPVCVITNIKALDGFEDIDNIQFLYLDAPDDANRDVKTSLIKHTPFDVTLYVDADAIVKAPVDSLFNFPSDCLCICEYMRYEEGQEIPKIYYDCFAQAGVCLPVSIYSGACFLFHKTPEMYKFFELWNKYWKAFGSGRDMPPLNSVLKKYQTKITQLSGYKVNNNHMVNSVCVQHYGLTELQKQYGISYKQYKPFDKPGQWARVPARSTAPKEMCVVFVCDDNYQKYIAACCYSWLKMDENCIVKIILTCKIRPEIQRQLDKINSPRIVIEELKYRLRSKSPDSVMGLRWVLEKEDFENCRYGYIGDIDIIACKTAQNFISTHKERCITSGLPYNNSVRLGRSVLSGLHFICVEEYYKIAGDVIDKYRTQVLIGNYKGSNEKLLYSIVKESGMCFYPDWQRPHYGLHLGVWRCKKKRFFKGNYHFSEYKEYFTYYTEMKKDLLFSELIDRIPEAAKMERELSAEFGVDCNALSLSAAEGVSCIVRSVGERTEKQCLAALETCGLKPVVVTGKSFYEVLKNSFEAAIKAGAQYCLMIDADCVPDPAATLRFVKEAKEVCDYAVLGRMDCFLYDHIRDGGVRLYKTDRLQGALEQVSEEVRPESSLHKKLGLKKLDIVCSKHGYGQYYRDLWRTVFAHAVKARNSRLLKARYNYWSSQSDIESVVCSRAYKAGLESLTGHTPDFEASFIERTAL